MYVNKVKYNILHLCLFFTLICNERYNVDLFGVFFVLFFLVVFLVFFCEGRGLSFVLESVFLKNFFSKQCSGNHWLFLITSSVAPVSVPILPWIQLGDIEMLQKRWNDTPNGMGTTACISSDRRDIPVLWLSLRQASCSWKAAQVKKLLNESRLLLQYSLTC